MDLEKKKLPKPKEYEGLSQFRPPLCFELIGKTFELVMNSGHSYALKFIDRQKLSYGALNGESKEYNYDCLKAEDDTYFINLGMMSDTNRTVYTFILDLEQSLVTSVTARMFINPKIPRLPHTDIVFGAIRREDGSIPEIRHGYTDEMKGKAVHWNYGTFGIVHVYSSERYYRVAFAPGAIERMRSENPGQAERMRDPNPVRRVYEDHIDCIKIKEGIYVLSMIEYQLYFSPRNKGNNLLFLMNFNRMYDVGRSYGHNGEGVPENYTFGAYGEYFDASETIAQESTAYIR